MTKGVAAESKASPQVSVMIVAYQAMAVIGDCLQSIFGSPPATAFEVQLTDNGTDGTADWVRQNFPDVKIVPSRGNVGFGAGNNAMAGHAVGEYLLLLNPDTVVQDGAIDRLVEFAAERTDAVAWGGLIASPDGRPDVSNYLTLPSLAQLAYAALGIERRFTRRVQTANILEVRKVDALCGAYFLIRADYFRSIGGFDETFFLYSEEQDLFTRIKERGDVVLATPASTIHHLIGTTGSMSSSRFTFKAKGLMHYARKHWGEPKATLAGLLIWVAALERCLLGLLKPDRSSRVARMGVASWPLCARPHQWWNGYKGYRVAGR